MTYSLERHGDRTEQRYWAQFLRDQFPRYGEVWASYIVPLTGRPDDIRFKADAELAAIGRGPADICNAQLHYTTLMHLGRVWDLRRTEFRGDALDAFIEAIVRLAATTDVADELLQRATDPTKFDAWSESPHARQAWRKANNYPLQSLRDYRNRLLHGRLPPYGEGDLIAAPKIGTESGYLDWRPVLLPTPEPGVARDFEPARDIVSRAWEDVLAYLDREWSRTLVPNLCGGEAAAEEEARRDFQVCPRCGTEMMLNVESSPGSIVFPANPSWACPRCGHKV